MSQALCWVPGRKGRVKPALVPVQGAHTSVGEKDVKQRVIVSKCRTAATTSAVKKGDGGCYVMWWRGGVGRAGPASWRYDQSRGCTLVQNWRRKESRAQVMASLIGIILDGVVTCSDSGFKKIPLQTTFWPQMLIVRFKKPRVKESKLLKT